MYKDSTKSLIKSQSSNCLFLCIRHNNFVFNASYAQANHYFWMTFRIYLDFQHTHTSKECLEKYVEKHWWHQRMHNGRHSVEEGGYSVQKTPRLRVCATYMGSKISLLVYQMITPYFMQNLIWMSWFFTMFQIWTKIGSNLRKVEKKILLNFWQNLAQN